LDEDEDEDEEETEETAKRVAVSFLGFGGGTSDPGNASDDPNGDRGSVVHSVCDSIEELEDPSEVSL